MKKAFIVILSLWWVRHAGAATCSDIGYYCNRYQRTQYIEMSGTQYLDTGIPINAKYDMELTWQNTQYVADKWASGIWTGYGEPTISLTGMYSIGSDKLFVAMYNIDDDNSLGPTDASIPFDTNIHTTYCYKDKGIWIDDAPTPKPANYEMPLPSDKNFLVGARQGTGQPGYHWYGRIYSFIFKNNGRLIAELVPAYDPKAEQYGMYDTVAQKFHGNLGSGDFTGGPFVDDGFPCTNAPEHAHYTGSGTANNCPWECNTGYVRTSLEKCAKPCSVLQQLHIGTKSFVIYAQRQTQPALTLRHQDQICYVNTQPGHSSNAVNIKLGNDIFHLVD